MDQASACCSDLSFRDTGISSLPLPISRFQALEIESEEFISDFLKSIAKHLQRIECTQNRPSKFAR